MKSTVALEPCVAFSYSYFKVYSHLVRTIMRLFLCLRLSGLNALPFDPATNNDPLQFNGSSGPLVTECPPLENTSENSKKRKRASLPPGTDNKKLSIAPMLQDYFVVSPFCPQPCRILNAGACNAQQRMPPSFRKALIQQLDFLHPDSSSPSSTKHQIATMGIVA